jgi:hypothetical protein
MLEKKEQLMAGRVWVATRAGNWTMKCGGCTERLICTLARRIFDL